MVRKHNKGKRSENRSENKPLPKQQAGSSVQEPLQHQSTAQQQQANTGVASSSQSSQNPQGLMKENKLRTQHQEQQIAPKQQGSFSQGKGRGRGRNPQLEQQTPYSGISRSPSQSSSSSQLQGTQHQEQQITSKQQGSFPQGRGRGRGRNPQLDQQTPPYSGVSSSPSQSSSSSQLHGAWRRPLQQQSPTTNKEIPQTMSTPKEELPETSIANKRNDEPKMKLQESSVLRTGGTKCQKKIWVYTNHFPLSLGKLTKAIHYDVTITPDKPKKLMHKVMEAFRLAFYEDKHPAFDGMKNLYSASQLCTNELSGKVNITEDDRIREFEVTIKQVTYVDLSCLKNYFKNIGQQNLDKPMQALQCIDVILRSAPALNCIPVGRSFFTTPSEFYPLDYGSELYKGFYQSAVLGWKPFLNVDVVHKAFPTEMPVLEYVSKIAKNANPRNPLNERELDMLKKHIKQLKVKYELPNEKSKKRSWRVNDLYVPPRRAEFTDDDGRKWTVEEYFAVKKNVQLKYPNWPTLWVGNPKRENKLLLPLEFCTIMPGQVVNRKMSEVATSKMIKAAATSAPKRLSKIRESITKANYNLNPAVTEFGITVSDEPEKIHARILQPPILQYAGDTTTISRGTWRAKLFHTKANIQSWTIICLDRDVDHHYLEDLETSLIKSGKNFGVNIPPAVRSHNSRNFSYLPPQKEKLISYFDSAHFDLVIVVIPDRIKYIYAYVKQAAELRTGRLTQCLKAGSVCPLKPSTADNILLKINTKLNGTNHVLSTQTQPKCFEEHVVIMGADVTHPSPDAKDIPSIAAVTCSYDKHGFQYVFDWRLQEPKTEIITDLEAMVMNLLRFCKTKNDAYPQRIIFFRDGVSDGEFEKVLYKELNAIRNACMKLQQNYKPPISFFVVQKRHHTRFFPVNERDSDDRRNFNVPAGTCVDTQITRLTIKDFYMVSHASIQGVARPTKYVPLWDDADMSEDDIQELTYYLCHLFARCNRSVSYPAPTYYAHLAAARAKVYVENNDINMDNLKKSQEKLKVKEAITRDLPMYFV